MGSLDPVAIGAALIQKYAEPMYYKAGYRENPTLSLIKKRTDFGGDNKVVVFRVASVQGTAPVFSDAQDGAEPSEYGRVTVTHSRGYTAAYVDGEALSRSKSMDDAVAKASDEVDSAMERATRSLAVGMFRNQGGAFGRATFSGATATLVDDNGNAAPYLATNFERRMRIQLSGNDGTSGSLRLAGVPYVTLIGVGRSAGTLTADQSWSNITGATASDFLFPKGWFGKNMYGFPAWTPTTAPSAGESFFGLDRSGDDRLFGWAFNGGGAPIKESCIDMLTILKREGAKTDAIVLNPLDWASVVKGEQSNVVYDKVNSFDDPEIGFQSFKIVGPSGAVDVIADLNCPKGRGHALQLNTWSFESSGPAPKILNEDGIGPMQRVYNADQYEIRIGWYGQLFCNAPGLNGIITF